MEASQTVNRQVPVMLIHGAWLSARSWALARISA
jgi:hypothetical protein